MPNCRYNNKFKRLNISSIYTCSRKDYLCKFKKTVIKKVAIKKDISPILKNKKIDRLISNIYIYKFPPILKWPEGLFIGIPAEIVLAMRKVLEHSSGIILNNIKELCFAYNVESSSYGDKLIIFPIEYIHKKYSKSLFIDTFAHEVGHALLEEILKDKNLSKMIESWHHTIKNYSLNYENNLFFDMGNSEYSLAHYQLEDYNEFFSELYSQILNYYDELINHVCKIQFAEVQIAYIEMIEFIMNYIIPFTKNEKKALLKG